MKSLFAFVFVLAICPQLYAATKAEISIHRICNNEIEYPEGNTIQKSYWKGQNIIDEPEPICLEKTALSSGYLISEAKVVSGEPDETYALKLILSDSGAEEFKAISTQNRFKRVAIVVDNKILTSVTFVETIEDREILLRGIGTGAYKIAEVINGH